MQNPQNPVRGVTSSIGTGIFLISLAIGFFSGHLLPVMFVGLAFSTLITSFGSLNPKGVYGGLQGFIWLLGLAFCFLVGFWPWILVVIGVSTVLGALTQPILAALMGIGILSLANRQPQQPPYQEPYQAYQQPEQPPYQPYQQGYQPPPQQPQETYQEGGQPQQYPQPQYDQPEAQYPQEMPPQQQ